MTRVFSAFTSIIFSILSLASCTSAPKVDTAAASPVEAGVGDEKSGAGADSPTEISEDCTVWRKASDLEKIESGFARRDETLVYFDLKKKLYVALAGKSAPYYFDFADASWNFIGRLSGISATTPAAPQQPRSVDDLMNAVNEEADRSDDEARWSTLFLGEQTKVVAVLQEASCSSVPGAKFITCDASSLNCSAFPLSTADGDGVKARTCLRELGLYEDARLIPLSRACSYFSSSTYEENLRVIKAKADMCRGLVSDRPVPLNSVSRIARGCFEIESAIEELK